MKTSLHPLIILGSRISMLCQAMALFAVVVSVSYLVLNNARGGGAVAKGGQIKATGAVSERRPVSEVVNHWPTIFEGPRAETTGIK
jgi:hypothetical protein